MLNLRLIKFHSVMTSKRKRAFSSSIRNGTAYLKWRRTGGLKRKCCIPAFHKSRSPPVENHYVDQSFRKSTCYNSRGYVQKLGDKVADAGFLVVVPDFLFGDPVNLENPDFDIAAWLGAPNAVAGYEDAKSVIAALKSKGVSAIGAAWFFSGGSPVVKLANNSDWIQAGGVLHPGPISKDDINEVKVPIALLGAENDQYFSAEDLTYLRSILAQKSKIDSFLKIYPGTTHGWTIRYNTEDDLAVKKAEEAHSDMLNWLTKYVK